MSTQVLSPSFNQAVFLVLSCWSSLYILDINPSLDVWLINILFHSVSCLFTLLIVSFAVQKLLFDIVPFDLSFLLLLLPVLLGSYSNNCPDQCHGAFSLRFLLIVYSFGC